MDDYEQVRVKNFINGKFEDSTTTKWIDVINPATQEVVCQVPQSTPQEVQSFSSAGQNSRFETTFIVDATSGRICSRGIQDVARSSCATKTASYAHIR